MRICTSRCASVFPSQIEHKSLSLGEVLDGDRMAKSLYKIKFKENLDRTVLCKLKLSALEAEQLKEAIEDSYYFEFVADGKDCDRYRMIH